MYRLQMMYLRVLKGDVNHKKEVAGRLKKKKKSKINEYIKSSWNFFDLGFSFGFGSQTLTELFDMKQFYQTWWALQFTKVIKKQINKQTNKTKTKSNNYLTILIYCIPQKEKQ